MRIKKLLVTMSLGLVLLTSAGVPALAKDLDENNQEGSSEIFGSIASRYTVEIPAEIEMGTMQRNRDSQAPFSITARNVALPSDVKLQVRVNGDGINDEFILKSSDSKISYRLFKSAEPNDIEIATHDIFAEFSGTIGQDGDTQSGLVQVTPQDTVNSGIYAGNLNFTCAINFPTVTP